MIIIVKAFQCINVCFSIFNIRKMKYELFFANFKLGLNSELESQNITSDQTKNRKKLQND